MILGNILIGVAYIAGIIFITIPLGVGIQDLIFDTDVFWAKYSNSIIIGLVVFTPFFILGDILKGRAKKQKAYQMGNH